MEGDLTPRLCKLLCAHPRLNCVSIWICKVHIQSLNWIQYLSTICRSYFSITNAEKLMNTGSVKSWCQYYLSSEEAPEHWLRLPRVSYTSMKKNWASIIIIHNCILSYNKRAAAPARAKPAPTEAPLSWATAPESAEDDDDELLAAWTATATVAIVKIWENFIFGQVVTSDKRNQNIPMCGSNPPYILYFMFLFCSIIVPRSTPYVHDMSRARHARKQASSEQSCIHAFPN